MGKPFCICPAFHDITQFDKRLSADDTAESDTARLNVCGTRITSAGRTEALMLLRFDRRYLFTTHNFGVVKYLAQNIATMKNGKLIQMGKAEDILQSPQHSYTQTLLAAVPRLQVVA